MNEESSFCQHEEVPELLAVALSKLFWRIMRWLGLPLGGVIVSLIVMGVNVNNHLNDGHPHRVETMVQQDARALSALETEIEIWRSAGMPLLLIEIKADLDNLTADSKEMKADMKALRNGSE